MCVQTSKLKDTPPIGLPGKCFRCEASIWLAPSTSNLIAADPEIKIACQECALNVIAENPGPPIFAMAPGAVQEIAQRIMKVERN